MKRFVRVVGMIGLVLLVVAAVGVSATIGWRPIVGPRSRPLTDRHFEATPARLARGEYLVNAVAPCAMCHSGLKANADGEVELVPGTTLAGRPWSSDGVPFLTAPNLTPDRETGIGTWTDDQIARAIREGIGHDGRTLFPIMPYEKFRIMTDEDLASVIVYLRAQAPIRSALPPTSVPFPVNRLINAVPQPVTAAVSADLSTPAKRGAYLATMAACADCHTPMDSRNARIAGLDFAGGFPLTFEGMQTVWGANITPGVNGIPYYDEALFIETLRTGRVRERRLSNMMPTEFYKHMTDDDLKAIFAYLQTLPPIDHYVDRTMPETDCPRCGGRHGGGARNKKLSE